MKNTGFKLVSVFLICKVGIQQFYPENVETFSLKLHACKQCTALVLIARCFQNKTYRLTAGVDDMSLPSDQHENEDDEENDAAAGEQRDDNRQ